MSLYYLLLLIEQFHNYPRLGGTLFRFVFISVSVVKTVGLFVLIAAFILPPPQNAAPRRRHVIGLTFCLFGGYCLLGTELRGLPFPDAHFSCLLSLLFMLIATSRLVCTEARIRKTIRTIVTVAAFSALWVLRQGLAGADRPGGVEGDPNYEALALIIVVPLALWMAHNESERIWRKIGGFAAATMLVATLLTESRGGLLALPIIGFSELAHVRKRPELVFAFLLGFGLTVVLAPSSIWQRFKLLGRIQTDNTEVYGDELSTDVHFDLLVAGLRMMRAHPLVGVGLDQFKLVLPIYSPELRELRITNLAHNTYLQVGAEGGMPALASFLMLMGVGLSNCRKVLQVNRNDGFAQIARSMRLCMIVYAVICSFLTAPYLVTYWLLIFISHKLVEVTEVGQQKQAIGGVGQLVEK